MLVALEKMDEVKVCVNPAFVASLQPGVSTVMTIEGAKELGGHVVECGDSTDGAWWQELGRKQGLLEMRVERLERSMRVAGQEYTVVLNGDAMAGTDAANRGRSEAQL